MAENNLPLGEENKDTYALILFFLHLLSGDEIKKDWSAFTEEIQRKSRFFPKSNFLTAIGHARNYATQTIPRGHIFYRARLLESSNPYEALVTGIESLTKSHFPTFDYPLNTESGQFRFLADVSSKPEVWQHFQKKLGELIRSLGPFWGYSTENSDAPHQNPSGGRANPEGISYLYVSGEVNTAIAEVRPTNTQSVSVATVQLDKDIKIFDFIRPLDDEGNFQEFSYLQHLSELFSTPNYGDKADYLPTQYICEYIKSLGFDGIRFRSALNPDGTNIVIFYPNSSVSQHDSYYTILESKMYQATLSVTSQQILPPPEAPST